MAEPLPVVTVPGDDEALGPDDISPEDIVVLDEVVVEELPVVEGFEGFESIDTTPFAVTEPSDPSEDVIVIGSSEEEEADVEFEVVERAAEGPRRRGMATSAGVHPVTVPSEMPIDDVPPDETITAFPVEEDTQNPAVAKGGDGDDDEVRVLSEEKVTVVEEVVEEVVEQVEVVTEEVTVKVSEVLSVKEAVQEAMETEGEKGEKKRMREGEEEEEALKKLKSEEDQEEEEEEALKKLKSEEEEEEETLKKLKSEEEQEEEEEEALKKLKSEEEQEQEEEEEEEEETLKKLKSEEEKKVVEPKKLGPKVFNNSVHMFSYFYNLLHDWTLNQNFNKYEFLVLSELVSQGNPQKVADGIAAFQVRLHPKWQSRCYYVIHKDGSEDDFSYRKCCDALMPLPPYVYRKNGDLNLEMLFPGQKGRHYRERQQQNGGGRGGGRGDHRGGRGGRFGGGRGGGGGGRGGRGGGGGRRGGRGRW